jgi:transcriptional regulator with XRE-family HTH domain
VGIAKQLIKDEAMGKERKGELKKGDDRKTLGERLREAREYVGFSQEDVAEFLGISRSALSLIESGQRKVDALELKKLAGLYKRPVGYFTGEKIEEVTYSADIAHLARKASDLSSEDREELARFADFLRARKQ